MKNNPILNGFKGSNIQEVQKNLEKTIKQLESYNNDSDSGFSALLQMLSSLLVILFSFLENIQIFLNICYFNIRVALAIIKHYITEVSHACRRKIFKICFLLDNLR